MSIKQCVTDQDAVLKMLKDPLLLQNHTTYTINGCRQFFPFTRTNVFVSIRTEHITRILVKSQIELCTMLDDGLVK